jgi:hypothetical protein
MRGAKGNVRFGPKAEVNAFHSDVRFTPESGFLLFHLVLFAFNALAAVSTLFPTLATAASSSSVVLLRRLRIRRAKSLLEITSRFRSRFGRDKVATAVLHWIKNEPPKLL